MTIAFYDIATLTNETLSTNTIKTYLCLKFKNLPFKQEWIELPDIEPFSIAHGIASTSTKQDGVTPFYTLPAIVDPSTQTALADSWAIAQYLDRTYPSPAYPMLFPPGSSALQKAFTDSYITLFAPGSPFTFDGMYKTITERGKAQFAKNYEERLGKPMPDDLAMTGEAATEGWKKYEESLGKLDAWYAEAEKEGGGPFLMGKEPVWADLAVAGMFVVQRTLFKEENQERWEDIKRWHNGRWGRLVELLEERSII